MKLWFFVGQSLYCIILEVDYGWLIEFYSWIEARQQNTKKLKLIVLADTVGVKKLKDPMLKSYMTATSLFPTNFSNQKMMVGNLDF